MADDNSKKSKSKRKTGKDESPLGSPRTVDSGRSESTALELKRKNIFDSLEHCRATRSETNKKSKSKHPGSSSGLPTPGSSTNESSTNTTEYIESLRSRSASRSGRYHDTSIDGKSANLKITSWNINGIKSWLKRRYGLTFIAQDDADIYCFQETKCSTSSLPNEVKNIPGYFCYWNGSLDRHSGVVCFAKQEPQSVSYGIGSSIYDREGRVITLEYKDYFVVNVYVPNSGRKLVRLDYRLNWDSAFYDFIKRLDSKKAVIICGDLNVSHEDIDLANPKSNRKTAGFTNEERRNFSKMLDDLSLVDVFRYLNPIKKNSYTYWTYLNNARERNIGWRLDYFLIPRRWLEKTCDCVIRRDVFGSDHCPVSLYLAL